MSDRSRIEGHQMIDGGPSALYDAVALIVSANGVTDLVKEAAARNFVANSRTSG